MAAPYAVSVGTNLKRDIEKGNCANAFDICRLSNVLTFIKIIGLGV
jgi:hypothetical protein